LGTIKDKIKAYEKSEQRQRYIVGEKYYDVDNVTINERRFEMAYGSKPDSEGRFNVYHKENLYKANNKIANGYYPLLIDQKIDYLLGNGITFKDMDDATYETYFGEWFQSLLQEAARGSAIKGLYYAFPYIENNDFKLQLVRPENIIIDKDMWGNITKAFRFDEFEYKEGSTVKKGYIVQEWDNKTVKIYEIRGNKETLLEEKAQISKTIKYGTGETIVEGTNAWGRVPFIPLMNNANEMYDLKRIKPLIDAYDIVNSDFANNLEDFQDIFWIIKNYNGTNLDSFLKEVKDLKVLNVGQDGDAKAETIETPHEARSKFLEITDRNIFKFGQGLDIDQLSGGSLTNVVIKARYSNLDLKSKNFETFVTKFIKDYAYFAGIHANTTFDVAPIYDRSMIINEVENLKSNIEQVGGLSEETRLNNHVWVTDAEEEIARMEKEREKTVNAFNTGVAVNTDADNE
jgi:SPP1 family phage portal protein